MKFWNFQGGGGLMWIQEYVVRLRKGHEFMGHRDDPQFLEQKSNAWCWQSFQRGRPGSCLTTISWRCSVREEWCSKERSHKTQLLVRWYVLLQHCQNIMFTEPCIIVIVEEWKTNLMSLAILFHFLCAQHVSDNNISIIRSLRLCWWITTSVVFFSVRCVLELWCGWF